MSAETYTGGLVRFRYIEAACHAHTMLEINGGRVATEVRGVRRIYVMLADLKRAINGYHTFKQTEHARRYLAEAAHRFNR